MRFSRVLQLSLLLAMGASAQVTLTGTSALTTNGSNGAPTGTYISYGSTRIALPTPSYGSTSLLSSSMAAGNSSGSTATSQSSTPPSITYLVGGHGTSSPSLKGTVMRNVTSTSSSAQPSNQQPCNGHTGFCNRKFSNITMIAAHNSPFVLPNNAASNQVLGVTTQLRDGIRMCG